MVEPVIEWDVVVVGGINNDYVVRGHDLPRPGMSLDGDVFLDGPGGKGANAAVAAARLGARTAIIGCVGNDGRGRAHIAALANEGVHVVHISVDPRFPTGAAVIHVDSRGKKQILAALAANLRLRVEAVEAARDTIQSSRVLLMQLEVPVDCVAAAARLGHDAGVRIVLDPAPPRVLADDLLGLVDVVRGNAAEVEALTGVHVHDLASARDGARALLARGVQAVIVEAEKGNLLVSRLEEEWLPELPAEAVDATGAGDAFSAALAVALAEREPLAAAGRFASGAAALSTTALGAQAGLPRRRELDAYLAQLARSGRAAS
jgi:ribokinase